MNLAIFHVCVRCKILLNKRVEFLNGWEYRNGFLCVVIFFRQYYGVDWDWMIDKSNIRSVRDTVFGHDYDKVQNEWKYSQVESAKYIQKSRK